MSFCVNNLNDGDRFEVIRFSTECEPLFGELKNAGKENVDKALSFVKDLKAIGGTAHLIYVGDGKLANFNGKDVEGSIVMVDFNSRAEWMNVPRLGARASEV